MKRQLREDFVCLGLHKLPARRRSSHPFDMTPPPPNSMDSSDAGQVLVEEKNQSRILILDRPQKLNAVTLKMVKKLLDHFTAFEDDPKVKLLIMKGKGKAFCAGGDVATVVLALREGNWLYGHSMFWHEFILNYLIATYNKPQVSLLKGIVMGGGAGLSIHGRYRVVTENTIFAMPETALGLFPDIGASYFLSRLPGYYGEYVGLTGARLDGAEMLACGLATHYVPLKNLSALEELLANLETSDLYTISRTIDTFSQHAAIKENSSFNRLDLINRCFSKKTLEDIICSLEEEALHAPNDWITSTLGALKKASPTSLKISLRSIREGRTQTVGECLIREFRMVCHVMLGRHSKDFMEGCRAILLDRDKNPKWMPAKLELVTDEVVDKYFGKVDAPGWEDLKIPAMRSGGRLHVSKL